MAVLVREYAASDLNGDAPAYWYSAQSEEWGLDPWRLVEGVDPHTAGGQFDVCFANGSSRTVGPLMTFFMSAADAARLNAKKEDHAPIFSR
nr:KleF protein [uncultured bacterium]